MRKINRRIKKGTQVLLSCDPENGVFREVIEINDTRVNLKVSGIAGSFQGEHIKKFRNKK